MGGAPTLGSGLTLDGPQGAGFRNRAQMIGSGEQRQTRPARDAKWILVRWTRNCPLWSRKLPGAGCREPPRRHQRCAGQQNVM